MARSHTLRLRRGHFVAVFAVCFVTFGGGVQAQPPSPLLSSSGILAEPASQPVAEPTTVPQPTYSYYAVPPQSSVGMGLFDTMAQSICGKPDPNTWHPLPLSSLFCEGWNEAWVPSPSGSGGAPRQGWINAADGNLYRLSFFTFAQGFNNSPTSNAYLGAYTILLPLSRRLELIVNTPFVVQNNAASGLPIIDPSQPAVTTTQSHTTFGDMSFTPRVLLHETKDFSLTAEVSVLTPTGMAPLAGNTSVTPAVGFWTNFSGGWVLRGGLGVNIPTQGGGDTMINQIAIGQTVTPHDVPLFGDFTYYVSAVSSTPLSSGGQPTISLTPGLRTHVGNDWYFLAGLPTPVTKQRVADLGMVFWFMKAW